MQTELQRSVAALAETLNAMRNAIGLLNLPQSPTLDELQSGLGVAWVSALRLNLELEHDQSNAPPQQHARSA